MRTCLNFAIIVLLLTGLAACEKTIKEAKAPAAAPSATAAVR